MTGIVAMLVGRLQVKVFAQEETMDQVQRLDFVKGLQLNHHQTHSMGTIQGQV